MRFIIQLLLVAVVVSAVCDQSEGFKKKKFKKLIVPKRKVGHEEREVIVERVVQPCRTQQVVYEAPIVQAPIVQEPVVQQAPVFQQFVRRHAVQSEEPERAAVEGAAGAASAPLLVKKGPKKLKKGVKKLKKALLKPLKKLLEKVAAKVVKKGLKFGGLGGLAGLGGLGGCGGQQGECDETQGNSPRQMLEMSGDDLIVRLDDGLMGDSMKLGMDWASQ